ncbi:hypothetical protein B7463_g12781, partial [Scytalidium lignicola]
MESTSDLGGQETIPVEIVVIAWHDYCSSQGWARQRWGMLLEGAEGRKRTAGNTGNGGVEKGLKGGH